MPNWNARGWPLENEPEPAPTRVKNAVVLLIDPREPDSVESNGPEGPVTLFLFQMLKQSALGSIVRCSLIFHDQESLISVVKKPGLLFCPIGAGLTDSA